MASSLATALCAAADDLQKHWRPLDGALGLLAFGASECGEAIGHIQDLTEDWDIVRRLTADGRKHIDAALELLGPEHEDKAGAIVAYAKQRAAIAQSLCEELERRLAEGAK